MQRKNLFLLVLATVVTLSGCNDNEQDSVQHGVYQGVIWGDEQQPLKAEVVVQKGKNAQLTLWDEREHQLSYVGVASGTELTFSTASVRCATTGNGLSCENSNGSTLLSPVASEIADLASFAGRYQSRYLDSNYVMDIDESGAFTVAGNSCSSVGRLSLSTALNGIVNMSWFDDGCLQAGTTNLVTLEIDNDSLISVNIQTESDNLPQVWVQL